MNPATNTFPAISHLHERTLKLDRYSVWFQEPKVIAFEDLFYQLQIVDYAFGEPVELHNQNEDKKILLLFDVTSTDPRRHRKL